MNKVILTSQVQNDEVTAKVSSASDFIWDGKNSFEVPQFNIPKDFTIGVITGPSGTGKSSILKQLGRNEVKVEWDGSKAICSQFEGYEDASEKLSAVALNSIPDILKPYHTLSTGQKARADVARVLKSDCTIDEFTSTVDRNVGKAMANSIRKYVDRKGLKNILLVSCHSDFIEYLNPDWVFDTKTCNLQVGRLARRRPSITLSVRKTDKASWDLFKQHHYLSAELTNNTPHSYLYYWGKELIGFGSLNMFPHPALKSCWSINRVVVYPDFQGLGFGSQIIKNLAEIATHNFNHSLGFYGRCKIVTAIPALQKKFDKSDDWQFIEGSNVRPKRENDDRKTEFNGFSKEYFDKHLHRSTRAYHYVGKKGFSNTENLTVDYINETVPFITDKNRNKPKETGKVVKDFRPPIIGETKYQLTVDPNYNPKDKNKCQKQEQLSLNL